MIKLNILSKDKEIRINPLSENIGFKFNLEEFQENKKQ